MISALLMGVPRLERADRREMRVRVVHARDNGAAQRDGGAGFIQRAQRVEHRLERRAGPAQVRVRVGVLAVE